MDTQFNLNERKTYFKFLTKASWTKHMETNDTLTENKYAFFFFANKVIKVLLTSSSLAAHDDCPMLRCLTNGHPLHSRAAATEGGACNSKKTSRDIRALL